MSAAKPILKQISWRAVQDPRPASPLREIWGTPQCDAAFADLERSVCSAHRSPENESEADHRNSGMRPVSSPNRSSARTGDLEERRRTQGLLGGDVLRAKSELAKHCTDITLTPKGNSYMVSGDWNLLGGRSGGAGGPAWTERLPVRFEWLAAA